MSTQCQVTKTTRQTLLSPAAICSPPPTKSGKSCKMCKLLIYLMYFRLLDKVRIIQSLLFLRICSDLMLQVTSFKSKLFSTQICNNALPCSQPQIGFVWISFSDLLFQAEMCPYITSDHLWFSLSDAVKLLMY